MGGFPALMIKQPESPIQQLAGVQQIQAGQQEAQARVLQIQQQQQQLKDQNAMTQAMLNWDGKNVNQLPMLALRNGGSAQAAFGIQNSILGVKQKMGEIAKDDALTAQSNIDTVQKNNDALRGRLTAAISSPDKVSAWDQELTAEEQAGRIQPGTVSHQYPGDDAAKAFADHFALGSVLAKEAQEKQKLALDAWKPVGGQLINAITNEKIGGIPDINPLNLGLKARWDNLHPGEPVPDYFQLKTGATPEDFGRVDKLLESTEKAHFASLTHEDAQAQREVANSIRQQTFEIQREKTDMNPVIWNDANGKSVLGPLSQAPKGAQPMKADDDTVKKALAGRHWLSLAESQAPENAKPEDMGIMQLINKLDSEGKLGPLASRYNDFMARKWGAGDPEYAALHAKMGLSTTLLGQVHVGNRLGPQLLEHFEDLANEKKMDAATLKAGFASEINYVREKAMDPNPPNYAKTPAPKAAASATQNATQNLKATHRYNPDTGKIEELP